MTIESVSFGWSSSFKNRVRSRRLVIAGLSERVKGELVLVDKFFSGWPAEGGGNLQRKLFYIWYVVSRLLLGELCLEIAQNKHGVSFLFLVF